MTFNDLNSEYGQEHITFRSGSLGYFRTACNHDVPITRIRDDSNGKTIWSSWFSIELYCVSRRIQTNNGGLEIDVLQSAENDIITIDNAGTHAVTVIYDTVSVPKITVV